jgi:hypothetical protein
VGQLHPRQPGMEFSRAENQQVEQVVQAGLVAVRIGEGAGARRRQNTLRAKRLGRMARPRNGDYVNFGKNAIESSGSAGRGTSTGRRSVSDGASPNSLRYSTAKRPSSPKP